MTTDNRAELEAALRDEFENRLAVATGLYHDATRWHEEDGPNGEPSLLGWVLDAALSSPPSDQERGLEEALWRKLRAYVTPPPFWHNENGWRTIVRLLLSHLSKPTPPTVEHAAPQAEVERECPFCGMSDTFVERADFSSCYVACNDCGARGPESCDENDSDADATESGECEPGELPARRRWNTRTSPTRERIVAEIVRDVAELGDRTSPDDWPEAMLVTGDELSDIIRSRLAALSPSSSTEELD